MQSTIYRYINTKKNSGYTGSSKRANSRKRTHKSRAQESRKEEYKTPFYNAIRKNGWDTFKYTELLYVPESQTTFWEKYFINFYNDWVPQKGGTGYNLVDPTDNHDNGKRKPCVVIDPETLEQEYIGESIADVAAYLNVVAGSVSVVINKNKSNQTAGGKYVCLLEELDDWRPPQKASNAKIPVLLYHKDKFIGEFESISQAAKHIGVYPGNLGYTLSGKRKKTKEYYLKYT
jgi:hypothetical protein